MDISNYYKAIAGGIVTAITAEVARFGFHPKQASITWATGLVTAIISYVVGHLVVYLSPANKP